MDPGKLRLVILADAPSALIETCGVSSLERLLRQAERLGFSRARILSATPEAIRGELAHPSWARARVSVEIRGRTPGPVAVRDLLNNLDDTASALVLPGDIYCDSRLVAALAAHDGDAALIDSARRGQQSKLCGPARISKDFLAPLNPGEDFQAVVRRAVETARLQVVDAALYPSYVTGMRREIRPSCVAVTPESRPQVDDIILDTAQNGTLDLPAYVHAPIETAIVSRLCRTNVTPNQITVCGFLFGLLATVAFFSGHFLIGLVVALIFGVIDGLDGKLARVKVETTARGQWEHKLDLVLEYSWWIALAFELRRMGLLPAAYVYAALLLGSDLIDRLAKAHAKQSIGRLLDDFSPFDRFFRLIGGRRNIYVWLLALAWIWRGWADAYRLIAVWGVLTAAVHVIRAVLIATHRRRAVAS